MKKLIISIVIFLGNFGLLANPNIPKLNRYANDFTGTFSGSEVSYLETELKTFDDSTSNQVVFLMINTLEDYPMEMFTYEVATQNKIGTNKNNGVLIFVALNDKKMRIEVGYGLEGALTDALASSILRNEMRPHFKSADYFGGVKAGVEAIKQAIKGEYTREDREQDSKPLNLKFFGYIILFILYILFSIFRRGRGGLIFVGGLGGGFGSGGFGSSGGGGGFSSGGFSGGGGSFGGGGSSGSW